MKQLIRLEQYTLKRPAEVLLVNAEVNGEPDQIMVFKGFSSSLMHSTEFDPDIPVLPEDATIISIDRVQSPYSPSDPKVIQADLTWELFVPLLEAAGV